MTSEIKRVSQKEIKPMLEAISPLVASIRIEVEKMPKCSKKEALMLSVVNFEKKLAIVTKELSEQAVMEYVNKHPELLQKFAHAAASDKGMVEVANEAMENAKAAGVDTNEQDTEKSPKAAGKRRH